MRLRISISEVDGHSIQLYRCYGRNDHRYTMPNDTSPEINERPSAENLAISSFEECHSDEKSMRATHRLRAGISRLIEKAADILDRAEKRITENFRIPPNGG